MLNKCRSGLRLVDISGGYQPAHIERSHIELVVAIPFSCLGEPLKLSAQRSKSVGSGPLWHSSGPFWTTLWHKELNQPLRNSSKLVPERIDPAIPVPIWMLGRWSNYISASSSVVDSGQDAGSIADARKLHVEVKALARRDQGPA